MSNIQKTFPEPISASRVEITEVVQMGSGSVISGSLIPCDEDVSIGNLEHPWKDAYISSGSLYVGGVKTVERNESGRAVFIGIADSASIAENANNAAMASQADSASVAHSADSASVAHAADSASMAVTASIAEKLDNAIWAVDTLDEVMINTVDWCTMIPLQISASAGIYVAMYCGIVKSTRSGQGHELNYGIFIDNNLISGSFREMDFTGRNDRISIHTQATLSLDSSSVVSIKAKTNKAGYRIMERSLILHRTS